jgi:hypothetical protein
MTRRKSGTQISIARRSSVLELRRRPLEMDFSASVMITGPKATM